VADPGSRGYITVKFFQAGPTGALTFPTVGDLADRLTELERRVQALELREGNTQSD
jgi:hypothetical protein